MPDTILVTAALPYANGPLHFGHVAGAYLPADVFVRAQRMLRQDVLFVCGTDEHGVAITIQAEREKRPYQEYVDHWHRVIRAFFERLRIDFDIFSQTSHRDPHYALSREFFLRLLENRKVEPRTTQQHFCTFDRRFLPDRFVEGTCYLCGSPNARGDECKNCGAWLDATRLIDPRCATCKNPPELRPTTQYELQLTGFQEDPAVRDWYRAFTASQKPNVTSFVVTKMVEGEGLKPRPITRDLPWGVPVPAARLDGTPLPGMENKVLYVWFDAPIGYVSATIEWARAQGREDLWRRYWIRREGEPGARLIQFIGKDNIPFHCIVFPAMLAWQTLEARGTSSSGAPFPQLPEFRPLGPGPGEAYVLPEAVPANEFYNLEGRKFSTSDGWYVELDQALESFSLDALRYYISATMPETADTQFSWNDFQAKVNELADVVGNFAVRVVSFVHRYRDGKVPAPATPRLLEAARSTIENASREFLDAVNSYQFRRGAAAFLELARAGNKLLDQEKPWVSRKSDPERCDEALHASLFLIKALVPLLHPYLPGAAEDLARMLDQPAPGPDSWDTRLEPLPAGHALGPATVLVAKIDDEQVEEQLRKLHARDPASPPPR